MPTYDYVCQSCEHAFEHFQSMSSKPLKKCPACGKLQLKRLIGTGAGIIFKGSGFYETDYRSSEYQQKAKQEKGGGAADAGAAAAKSDDKGESKSTSDSSSSTPETGSSDTGDSAQSSSSKAKPESSESS